MSTFRGPVTAVTWAPSALAIWTAYVPTPPPAPWMRTRCPGFTSACARSACSAVWPATLSAGACLDDGAREVDASDRLVLRARELPDELEEQAAVRRVPVERVHRRRAHAHDHAAL